MHYTLVFCKFSVHQHGEILAITLTSAQLVGVFGSPK